MRKFRCRGLAASLLLWNVMGIALSVLANTPDAIDPSQAQPPNISPPESSSSLSSSSSTATSSNTATSMASKVDSSLNSTKPYPASTSEEPLSTSALQSSSTPHPTSLSLPTSQLPSLTTSLSSASTQPPETTTPLPSPSNSSIKELYNLTKEFFQWKLQDSPEQTSAMGINDQTAGHLDKLSHEHSEQRRLKCEDFLQRAQKIDTSAFTDEDFLNHKLFIEGINTYLRNFKYLKFFTPINFMSGPQHTLQQGLKKSTVLDTYNDYLQLLSRYSEFPRQAEDILNLMKGNMVDGLMPSNWSLVGLTQQFDNLLVPYNESVLYKPFLSINLNITTQQKEALKQLAEKPVKNILLSYKKIRDFIEAEYIPAARTTVGVSSLPGGLEYYKACLRYHTTTDMTPQQIHDLGLSEVSRIQEEVAQTAVQLGLANKTLAEISRIVKEDPSQNFNSKEDLLNTYRNAVYNVIYPLMDRIVNEVPSINVSVEENISGLGYANYNDPSRDGSRPGIFYINAKIYDQHKRYEVTALSLHEAVPGHHLQAVHLKMNPNIPDFRKYPDFYRYGDIPAKFPMNTAFSEGWGLYSEYLGNELGLYEDPYQRLGRHSFELLRASRLVVDTGLHAFGWTRQQAIDFLVENTAMSEGAIKRQIDRYIIWPGQACAYKVGEIKIRELRKKTENALGDLFRLQDFHDVVLGCIGPLNILEECVNSYITKSTT